MLKGLSVLATGTVVNASPVGAAIFNGRGARATVGRTYVRDFNTLSFTLSTENFLQWERFQSLSVLIN